MVDANIKTKKQVRNKYALMIVHQLYYYLIIIKAGNLFKISKLWREAGDAFVRSAEIHAAATDRKHDAASNYAEAANCYRKVNPQVNFLDFFLSFCLINI